MSSNVGSKRASGQERESACRATVRRARATQHQNKHIPSCICARGGALSQIMPEA
ncbi:hypothetical protein IG631_23639 [Alternaria alternata]|nr:hypothetical protein IG631_23639 [Alternaria alternata]